jgi:hypothetical protein
MSAIRTLAWGIAAWVGLGSAAVHADSISQSKAGWPWTMFWPAGAVSSYQATSAAQSITAPAPVSPAPAPAPAPAPVTPLFASAPATTAPAAAPALVTNVAMTEPTIAAPTPPASTAAPVEAFINMTAGPFPGYQSLTTGTPQPWYDSPSAIQAFGGVPTTQQQANFVQTVLQDVQHTFQLTGMNPTLTTDPNTPALHTLSVVSGLSYAANPSAIGITNVGGNGFSLIDKLDYATNPTDLAWAVAHNVSHELMHAFGIGYHPDGGNYVDAATANWSTLIDPNAQFGPAATQLLLTSQYGTLTGSTSGTGVGAEVLNPLNNKVDGDEVIAAVPAPEPAAMAMWTLGALGGLVMLRRRAARRAA